MDKWKLANPHTKLYCKSEKITEDEFLKMSKMGMLMKYDDDMHIIDKHARIIARFSPEFGYCKIV